MIDDFETIPDTLSEREEENLPSAVTTEEVIEGYFSTVESSIFQFSHYRDTLHEINFLKLRRFLLTTYNNLIEIDLLLNNTEISHLHRDLHRLSEIYDEFKQRSVYVKKAFHELFLSRHHEFSKYQKRFEENKEQVKRYEYNIQMADSAIQSLEKMGQTIPDNSEYYPTFMAKMKTARAKSVDAVHGKRSLEEENSLLAQYISMIINENEESFREKFSFQAKQYDHRITTLLNKLAYTFDVALWKNASRSPAIKRHFEKLNTKGTISSLTYLRYYLKSLSSEKLTEENQALFKLLPYLESLERHSILYLSNDVDLSLQIRKVLSSINIKIDLKIIQNPTEVAVELKKNLPKYIFFEYGSNMKNLLKILRALGLDKEIILVMLVDRVHEGINEQLKQIHIDHVIGTRILAPLLKEKFMEILQ